MFIFRWLFGFLRLKFILCAIGLYFAWTTLGTFWTVLIAWALAAYGLYNWGPQKSGGHEVPLIGFATRGNPVSSVLVPVVLPLVWPWFVIAHLLHRDGGNHA